MAIGANPLVWCSSKYSNLRFWSSVMVLNCTAHWLMLQIESVIGFLFKVRFENGTQIYTDLHGLPENLCRPRSSVFLKKYLK